MELDHVYSYNVELGPMKCMGPVKLICVGFDHEKLDTACGDRSRGVGSCGVTSC